MNELRVPDMWDEGDPSDQMGYQGYHLRRADVSKLAASSLLEELALYHCEDVPAVLRTAIPHMPHLRMLTLPVSEPLLPVGARYHKVDLETVDFDSMLACPSLHKVAIYSGMREGCLPTALLQLSALTQLQLSGPDHAAVGVLAQLPAVADLIILRLRLQPPQLCELSRLTQLTSLALWSVSFPEAGGSFVWAVNHEVGSLADMCQRIACYAILAEITTQPNVPTAN